jgi:hypothetical protein
VAAVFAVLTAVLAVVLIRMASAADTGSWLPAVLVAVAAAYATLAGLLTWHVLAGIPFEGYLSGEYRWAIRARRWLAAVLLFPSMLLTWASRRMHGIMFREILAGRDRGEKVVQLVVEAGGGGSWVLSNHAVYVISPKGVSWRVPLDEIHTVTYAAGGPWARTEIVLTVAAPLDDRHVRGTFTLRDARRVQTYLAETDTARRGAG